MKTSDKKIAVIGDKDSVLYYRAIGFDTFVCDNIIDGASVIKRLVKSESYAVIFVTETLYSGMYETIDMYSDMALPSIVSLPEKNSDADVGRKRIKHLVEKAVGADILFKESN